MDASETVQLYEDVNTEVVESCYTLQEVASPKKRKSKAQEDIHDKPKKPRSAYLLYYFDFHQVIQLESPNLPQSEINKRISESWKRLNVAEKGYYLEKAKLERDGVDTSSVTSTQDLSGFRKILPRANYVLMSKESPSGPQAVGGSLPPEPAPLESLEPPVPEGTSSVPLPPDPQYPALALDSEQCIAIGALAEEAASMTETTAALQGILPPSASCPAPEPLESRAAPSPCPDSCGVLLDAGAPTNPAVSVYSVVNSKPGDSVGGAEMQPMRQDIAQVVSILPAQNRVEPKSAAAVNSVSHVMMVSVGAGLNPNTKPSYKMAVKTYTRRGRGRCLAPGCAFVYVTRHKPPFCPECGNHLGGKWVPAAKKTAKQSKQFNQKAEISSSDGCQPTLSADEGHSTSGPEDTKHGRTEGQRKQGLSQQPAAVKGEPLEGSSTKAPPRARQLKPTAKGITVKGHDKSHMTIKKRPVRPILPAYCTSVIPSVGRAVLQFITVPPDKGRVTCNNPKSVPTVPGQSMSGLKPSTLKQLGHIVPATASGAPVQSPAAPRPGSQYVASLDSNILSVVPFKQNSVSSFDLGLSTARGRGRCKNPACDYVYKNRHKPADCPTCGWELTRKSNKGAKAAPLLDPYRPLSPAQRELQRRSTLLLLRRALQIPEGEAELQDVLALIQDLNGATVELPPSGQQGGGRGDPGEGAVPPRSGWPRYFESAAAHCGLCQYPLFKGGQSTVAGQEDCWLLTGTLIQTASLQLKVCLNTQCLALHSFTDIHQGLFNIGNTLLVSLDLFLKMRDEIHLGQHPSDAAATVLDHIHRHPVHALVPEEASRVQALLLSGYWAFESLTVRDYNDMICGVCGVAPKVEVAQRFPHNVLELHNVQFTWPETPSPDEVHVDDFWLTMESEAIEQAAFPSDIPVTQVDASIVAPFIPPLMRSPAVINTEKDKVPSDTAPPAGGAARLVRLIHEGQLRLDALEDHPEEELQAMLRCCGESPPAQATREDLLGSLLSLYAHVQNGLSTAAQPPPHLTAGKLSKVCPHKVVCGSKYLVRGETARDHVDLLVSSRYWPPVYVTDSARAVALCTDLRYPELGGPMWGRNQGCFSDPLDRPQLVSCAELQDQPGGADLSPPGEEDPLVHPVTRSCSRWLVHPQGPPALDHHSMGLCRELEPLADLAQRLELEGGSGVEGGAPQEEVPVPQEEVPAPQAEGGVPQEEVQAPQAEGGVPQAEGGAPQAEGGAPQAGAPDPRRPLRFDNAAYYYLYNRLVDFLRSRAVVSGQIGGVLAACQPGEVVIRDALYRLGVAQINTEQEAGLEAGPEAGQQDAVYEVLLQ
ncbi:HMG domain-containing protein 3 [Gadus chalcogrammus]|uniref:HMG domain-containing protein 3 n=1 Tax=Gadus chalcogrammus TaxID=1042646 RepID=UPI0024C4D4EC|nr:HMG domain-containing protein 3 [Gadus chalcogrammus]